MTFVCKGDWDGLYGENKDSQDYCEFTSKSRPPANKRGQLFDKMPKFKMHKLGGVLLTVMLESLPASALEI